LFLGGQRQKAPTEVSEGRDSLGQVLHFPLPRRNC